MKIGIKDEDAFLVPVASSENLNYLITFNRKHLRNKVNEINCVLKKYELNKINILLPDEI